MGRPLGIDETGNRYGLLQVTGRAETRMNKAYWFCVCDCGNKTTVRGRDLRDSKTRSCGCMIYKGGRKPKARCPAAEDRARRRRIVRQNEDKLSTNWVHNMMVHAHKPRVPAKIIDRGAVMPAARLFAAGIISRAEMMSRITLRSA